MKISIYSKQGVCSCCKKQFSSGFEVDINKRFINNPKICKSCLENLQAQASLYLVPKSPKNINAKIKNLND